LVPVTGTVTQGGKPLEGITVGFIPVESGPASLARTNSEGKFVLVCENGRAGAAEGKYKVTLTTVAASSGPVDMADPAQYEAAMKAREASMKGGVRGAPAVEKKKKTDLSAYASPKQSPFEFEVKAGGANEFDIPLP
jgi:hypothetical protein